MPVLLLYTAVCAMSGSQRLGAERLTGFPAGASRADNV